MDHLTPYYKNLLAGFIRDEVTAEQAEELLLFIGQHPGKYKEILDDPAIQELSAQQAQASELTLSAQADTRIKQQVLAHAGLKTGAGKIFLLHKWGWVAAAVLLVGATTAITMLRNRTVHPITIAQGVSEIPAPQVNKAVITLANGDQVLLDSATNGSLAVQGDVTVIKQANGQIAYQLVAGSAAKALQYNTLNNPRGSRIVNISLSDGTKIWLNAGSSITYPVIFTGNERKVKINGEGYFEVASLSAIPGESGSTKDGKRSFIVEKNDMQVIVLGTHFNVSAYDGEAIRTTLLEGSVKVLQQGASNAIAPGNSVVIRPGQQATLTPGNDGIQVLQADTDKVMSWKRGAFNFDDKSFTTVMKELERWYDIQVVYEGKVPNVAFTGELKRTTSLNSIIRILSNYNVQLKLEGQQLIVQQP